MGWGGDGYGCVRRFGAEKMGKVGERPTVCARDPIAFRGCGLDGCHVRWLGPAPRVKKLR